MHLAERDFALLRRIAVAQANGPLRVEELAAKLEMTPSALVRRAKTLQDAGWLQRSQSSTPRGRVVHYLPVPRLSVQWITHNHTALEWSVEGEFEMDFPLATQIPDRAARVAARRFLWKLRREGLLDAEYHREDGNAFETLPGLAVIAYGSAARGDAREDSDLDIIVVLADPPRKNAGARKEAILDAAAATSIEAPRPLQVRVIGEADLAQLPQEIRRALRKDGLIVFDSMHDARVWTLVYGGRK